MRAKQIKRTRTVEVDGRTLRVSSRTKTHQANPLGFRVDVKDIETEETETFTLYVLERERAEDNAVARFLGVGPGAIE